MSPRTGATLAQNTAVNQTHRQSDLSYAGRRRIERRIHAHDDARKKCLKISRGLDALLRKEQGS